MPRFKQSILYPVLLTLLILFHLGSNYIWIRSDESLPKHDENEYFIKSLTCYRILTTPGADKLSRLLHAEPKVRPHLFSLSAAPFYLIGGESYDIACLSNSIFLILLLVTIYRTGRRLYGRPTGFWAAFILSFYPFVTRFSRLYWSEICLMAFFSLSLYLLLKTNAFRSRKYSCWLGFAIGLGMLAKQQYLALMLTPILIEGVRGLFFTDREDLPEASGPSKIRLHSYPLCNLILCILIGAVITIPYYLLSFRALSTKFLYGITGGAWNPTESVFSLKSLLWYLGHIQRQVSLFFFLLLIPAVIWAGLSRERMTRLLAITFFAGYLILSFYPGKDARYISTLLPLTALFIAAAVNRLKPRALKITILALITAVCSLNFIQVSWNRGPFSIPYHKSRIRLPVYDFELHLFPMANPPARLPDWKGEDIISNILNDCQGAGVSVLVTPYLPDFSVNTFKYISESKKLPLQFVTVGTKHLYHFNFKPLIETDYIITKTGKAVPFTHLRFEYAERTNELINNPGTVFGDKLQLIAEYDLPDQTRARLYKRVAPHSNREKIEIIRQALKINPEHPWAHLALGEACLEEGDLKQAMAAFGRVVELLPDWPGGYLNIGRVYLAEDKTEEAFQQIRLCLEIAPEWPFAHYVLGEAYEQDGKPEEAIEQYIFALQGKHGLPRQAGEKLKKLGVDVPY
jgi:dolichyl-phosphate-mannose-protein mannosyltransferase/tetratricopeptide repeat protein